MRRDSFLIGEMARRTGVSRKALRLYEAGGILPSPRRTAAGYRVYDADALGILSFVTQARGLGFRLEEIRDVVAIKRSGRAPCPHVRDLVRRKAAELDHALENLSELRSSLRALLRSWDSRRRTGAAVCPHIEQLSRPKKRRRRSEHGEPEGLTLPGVRRLPRS